MSVFNEAAVSTGHRNTLAEPFSRCFIIEGLILGDLKTYSFEYLDETGIHLT